MHFSKTSIFRPAVLERGSKKRFGEKMASKCNINVKRKHWRVGGGGVASTLKVNSVLQSLLRFKGVHLD